jgi:hypothetical protein
MTDMLGNPRPDGRPTTWHLLDENGRLDLPEPRHRYERRPVPAGAVAHPARVRAPRRPAAGLAWLVGLGLLAAFFGWFSAEPLWLTLGHGVSGTATVVDCSVHGIAGRCAEFTPDSGAYPATRVVLLGLGQVRNGQRVAAHMVSAHGWQAYAGDRASLYLRWISGLTLVLLCGAGIAWATGAARVSGRRRRILLVLASVAAPVLLAAGLFAAAF